MCNFCSSLPIHSKLSPEFAHEKVFERMDFVERSFRVGLSQT